MKKVLRVLLPILLVLAILAGSFWYLFVYDREFTRDMLLECARFSENQGNHTVSTWFYNLAYAHAEDNEAVAIELAQQYIRDGNYTKAEYTLTKAIADGGNIDVYVALCKVFVEQDKLLDAVTMLNSVTNDEVKSQLDTLRPRAPEPETAPGFFNQYVAVGLTATDGKIYATCNGSYPSTKTDLYSEPLATTDGENRIYALVVNDKGLVSPLTNVTYTIGGIIKEMQFVDQDIEIAIRDILGADDGRTLQTNDLWTIREFTAPAGVSSYEDLQYLTHAEKLTLEESGISDFSFLKELTELSELTILDNPISRENFETIASLKSLKRLTLRGCSISTISGIEKLTNLQYLDLSENVISNLTPLTALTALEELYLNTNAINDISALSGMTVLGKLDLSGNSVTSLAPVASLTALIWLKADDNTLTELGAINNLTELTYLSVSGNNLTSVAELASCTKLVELNISNNALTDITMLSTLVKMMYFDFSHNAVEKIPEFPTKCELVTISGTKNLISTLDPLKGMENLNVVNMDYNEKISSVDCLARCSKLVQVNVYGTKVKNAYSLTEQDIIVNYTPVS